MKIKNNIIWHRLRINRAEFNKISHNHKMGADWINKLANHSDSRSIFYLGEALLVLVFGVAAWFIRPKSPDSQFKVREADLPKKPFKPKAVLALEGISIHGSAEQILGVTKDCTEEEVQKAYRDLMKKYHPDKVAAPGSPQWHEAQKIAEAINRARSEMILKLQSQRPRPSDR